ncbi:restriction endonuclease subunit S [Ferrimonas balearica]|uniref:restriction endonuclease subunit S n=1 Tax=Ferrimonas balearica TaxID=44012 RepID=UPI001C58E7E6|nr:restriction endonuclease subunit S [Ferrimonas balearica]MBW3164595.1 restriction endonuclease subunit S [Ferrimonas balearica]
MSTSKALKVWSRPLLGDVISLQNGFAFKSSTYKQSGHFVIRIGNVQDAEIALTNPVYVDASDDKTKAFVLGENDLLMSLTGNVGRVAFIKKNHLPAVLNQRVARLFSDTTSCISKKYLFYFLRSPAAKDYLLSVAKGAAQLNISGKDVLSIDFPLPSLAEQQEIAAQLDQLLAQVDSIKARLDALPAILKRFRQSVLAAAVSGKLTEEWRHNNFESLSLVDIEQSRRELWEALYLQKTALQGKELKDEKWKSRYPSASDVIHDPLSIATPQDLPKSWTLTNLDSVSVLTTGKTPQTTDKDNWDGEVAFISPSQVHPDGYILEPARYVSNIGLKSVPIIREASTLIVCIGTIGKVGFLNTDSVINQQLNAITPTDTIHPKFMYYWCKTLHQWLNKTASATVNAAIINKARLSEAPFPLTSLEEQTEIVRQIEQYFAFADQVEQQVQNAQARVNKLTQSILAKAFRGELTAQWRADNPELISGDNSAEALLAKIQAERAAVKPACRKSKD